MIEGMNVAALAEHRRDDARERHDPLEVIEVLRVDEDLEGLAPLMVGVFVQQDVVDGHVHRVVGDRRLDLVGRADEHLRPLDLLVQLHHLGAVPVAVRAHVGLGRGPVRGRTFLGPADAVLHDAFVDWCRHAQNFP
jgi:hypothetical protein